MKNLDDLLPILAQPFHPSDVTWKPGAMAKGGSKALALAYADLRAYQNRLDELCGADWSVSYTPWGERIVCNLTICGVSRSSTGEPDTQSERSEIAGTAAEAQAFKRACAMFGLGRYLYTLPSVWTEYDAERKQFTANGKSKLDALLIDHYRRSMGRKPEPGQQQATGAGAEPDIHEQKLIAMDELGASLYGEQWPQVRTRNVKRISANATGSAADLSDEQIQRLIDGLYKLANKDQAA